MRRERPSIPVLAAFVLAAVPVGAQDGEAERTAGLSATLGLFDEAGAAISRPASDKPFRVRVDVVDVLSGQPSGGLKLEGWFRPHKAGDIACREAARAYRATGRTPQDVIDLNGTLIATLNADGSFGVVDPKLNLRSSNMIAAARFSRRADAMALERAGMRAFLAFRQEGRIDAVSLLDGSVSRFGLTLSLPSSVAIGPGGDVWVGESGTGLLRRFTSAGEEAGADNVGPGDLTVRNAGRDDENIAAFSSGGGVVLLKGETGEVVFRYREDMLADVAFPSDAAVLALPATGRKAILRYLDDPQTAIPIPLGLDAKRIVASRDGAFAIAYTPGEPLFAVVDLASARVVQSIGLDRGATVSQVAFGEKGAYLISHDGGYAGAIDLAAAAAGKSLAIQRFNLASSSEAPDPASRLLTFLGEGEDERVMAVDPANRTGWMLHRAFAFGDVPPMEAVNLRGGVPFDVQAIERGFTEIAPGQFETAAQLAGGAYELVLTSGIGGMTACLPIEVDGPQGVSPEPYTIEASTADGAYRADREQEIRFRLADAEGREIDVESVEFLVSSLTSSWPMVVSARRSRGEPLRAKVRFPHPGLFVIQPTNIPYPLELRHAVILEVKS